MAEHNLTPEQERHIESHKSLYIKVWAWLAFFTAVEYLYAHWAKDAFGVLVLGLLTCAIIKAAMVGWYFMHLKFEGNWVYGMLVPAAILAAVFTLALFPDVAMQPITEENPAEEEATVMRVERPQPMAKVALSPKGHRNG